MLMLTSTTQTAEAVTQHNNNNNKKNVIDYRFPKKYDESAIRKQQCLNGTQTLHIFIYKKKDVAQSLRVHPPNSLSAKLHRPANAPSYRLQIFAGPYHYFLTPKRYTHSILVIPL